MDGGAACSVMSGVGQVTHVDDATNQVVLNRRGVIGAVYKQWHPQACGYEDGMPEFR